MANLGLVLTGRPGPIGLSSVHRILTNPYYKGDIRYKGATYKGTHEAIVSREVWYQVQSVLDSHKSAADATQIHDHYLKGTVVTLSANWRGFSDAQWRPPLPRTRGGGSDALRVRKAIPIRLPGLATLTPVDPPGSIRAVSPSGAVPMPTAPLTLSCQ